VKRTTETVEPVAPSQDQGLAGRRALVTGAALRLGRATALALASAGVHVVAHYRSSAKDARALVAELRRTGVDAWAVRADLDDPRQAEGLFAKAVQAAGPVDFVVNNASIYPESSLADLGLDDLVRNVRVNAWSPFVLGRALAAQGRGGCVVNLLDARVSQYDRRHAAYHLSKRLLFSLTRVMALEFAPALRVNAVAPGPILPPPGEDETFLRRVASLNPLRAWGNPGQVAEAVLFLLRSGFVTGQVLFVDGGCHMKGSSYGC
jgi:NAD(P)-dependent dehydrogenase (short-subunit alcohol dehydrogenase family)